MKFTFQPRQEGGAPAWPWIGAGLLSLAAVGAAFQLVPRRLIPPCGFRLMTGHPCPSCGMTRMGSHLLRGHLATSFTMNPFLFSVVAALGLWVATGAVARLFGRDFFIEIPAFQEKWIWLTLGAGFLANWWYLWSVGR